MSPRHRSVLFAAAVLTLTALAPAPAVAEPVEVMSGRFSCEVVTLFVDAETVQTWLPSGLRVAEDCPFDYHPIMILYGTQRDLTREKRITIQPRSGRLFHEAFVAVPYCRVSGNRRNEHLVYFARIYLDSERLAEQGIKRFGWAKVYTQLYDHGRTHRIWSPSGQVIFEAAGGDDDPRPVGSENESLQMIHEMLGQTLVLKHEGQFHRHNFDLHPETANIKAVSARIRIQPGFMPHLATMEKDIPGIDEIPFGAFHMDCRFTRTAK